MEKKAALQVTKSESERLKEAKDLYLDNHPVSDIAKKLDLPRTTLYYHINNSWKQIREQSNARLLKGLSRSRLEELNQMQNSALKVVSRVLCSLTEGGRVPTAGEAVQVARIMDTLSKMTATEKQTADTPLDINVISEREEAIASDPFLNTKETND